MIRQQDLIHFQDATPSASTHQIGNDYHSVVRRVWAAYDEFPWTTLASSTGTPSDTTATLDIQGDATKPLPTLPSEGGTVGRRRRTLTSIFNPTAPGPTTALSVTTDALTRTPSSSSKGDDKEKSTDKRRGEKDKVTFSKPEEGRDVASRVSGTRDDIEAVVDDVESWDGERDGEAATEEWECASPGWGHAADRAASVRADLGRNGSGGERESTRTVGKSAGGGAKRERRGTLVDLWPPKGK
ncbi:hypothetical protein BDZ89DRAFT_1134772 [Hymenopellis radicata]|nr:hypothetical protein BDZ89DRAFT_1134772 [Hymenopellis radicata]